jgi:hypothetical protein
MGTRVQLNQLLKSLLGSDNVYYQPPENISLKYPCIIYGLESINTKFADNNPYSTKNRYKITILDSNPDSLIPDKIGKLESSIFDRIYKKDNINHFVYKLYY